MPLDRQTLQVTSQVYGRFYTAPPSQRVCPHTPNCNVLRNTVRDNQQLSVMSRRLFVFLGLIFSMVGLEWELLLVAQHVGSLVADHWSLLSSSQLFCCGWSRCSISVRSLYIIVDILPLIFLILQLSWSLARGFRHFCAHMLL